jgi:SAM-dependent methyltransferase
MLPVVMSFPTAEAFRKTFAGMTDEQWHAVLVRSVRERIISGVEFPRFPPDEVQLNVNGAANAVALQGASDFYRYIKEQCARYDRAVDNASALLDFGVGWGRIIRFFLKDVEPAGLHGVDVSVQFLELCRDLGIPGTLSLIDPVGSLPYADNFFDLVYAYSVFTHLPERVADIWLNEISRVLRPGGLLVATVQPPRFLQFCASITPDMAASNKWHRTLQASFLARPSPFQELERLGIVYLSDRQQNDPRNVYGNTVVSPDYVQEHWARFLTIRSYLDDEQRFAQGIVVAQRGI